MDEVEAVKAAIANTTDFDGDRMASRYSDRELRDIALAAISALDAARGDPVARVVEWLRKRDGTWPLGTSHAGILADRIERGEPFND